MMEPSLSVWQTTWLGWWDHQHKNGVPSSAEVGTSATDFGSIWWQWGHHHCCRCICSSGNVLSIGTRFSTIHYSAQYCNNTTHYYRKIITAGSRTPSSTVWVPIGESRWWWIDVIFIDCTLAVTILWHHRSKIPYGSDDLLTTVGSLYWSAIIVVTSMLVYGIVRHWWCSLQCWPDKPSSIDDATMNATLTYHLVVVMQPSMLAWHTVQDHDASIIAGSVYHLRVIMHPWMLA